MVITVYELNYRHPGVAKMLTDRQKLHMGIQNLFDASRTDAGVLYRLWSNADKNYLFVKSEPKPLGSEMFCVIKQKELDNGLDFLQEKRSFRFRLQTVPGYKSKGKMHYFYDDVEKGISAEKLRRDWVKRKLEENGGQAEVIKEIGKDNIYIRHSKEKGGRGSVTFWDYKGIIKVTDAALFRNLYRNGLGREKAYGAGLIILS